MTPGKDSAGASATLTPGEQQDEPSKGTPASKDSGAPIAPRGVPLSLGSSKKPAKADEEEGEGSSTPRPSAKEPSSKGPESLPALDDSSEPSTTITLQSSESNLAPQSQQKQSPETTPAPFENAPPKGGHKPILHQKSNVALQRGAPLPKEKPQQKPQTLEPEPTGDPEVDELMRQVNDAVGGRKRTPKEKKDDDDQELVPLEEEEELPKEGEAQKAPPAPPKSFATAASRPISAGPEEEEVAPVPPAKAPTADPQLVPHLEFLQQQEKFLNELCALVGISVPSPRPLPTPITDKADLVRRQKALVQREELFKAKMRAMQK